MNDFTPRLSALLILLGACLPAVMPAQINIFLGGAGAGDDSDFSIANAALPLTLISFTATAEDRTVALSWNTENERDFAGFRVECSNDERTFRVVGYLPGSASGESGKRQHYRFTDRSPSTGPSFYRLRIINVDGSTAYSDLRSVTFTEDVPAFGVSPNPSRGEQLTVHFDDRKTGELLHLAVYDMQGRTAYAAAHHTVSGQREITVPVSLPEGNYFVRLQREDGGAVSRQLVVAR